ncbi:MAG: DNA-3-methyladenine glycosylase I [Holosporaceae bacterium]|nr:DNA-3-methyladenine glycosylase I [Holosporaceae bacterium]
MRRYKLGSEFVDPTIIHSFMQAIGIVNDHDQGCNFR